MYFWLFNVYIDAVMKEVKIGMERRGVEFRKERREQILHSLLYADLLVLCGELKKDLRPK